MENDLQLSKQPVSYIDNAIIFASKGQKIGDMSDVEIGKLFKLMWAILQTPPRNMPDQTTFDLLKVNIKQLFADITKEEILLAINLAIKKTINFDFKLFDQVFGIVQISDLIAEYKKYTNPIIFQQMKVDENKTLTTEETEQLNKETVKQAIIQSYQEFLKTNKFDFDYVYKIAEIRYDFLTKYELCNFTEELKAEFKIKATEFQRNQIETKLSMKLIPRHERNKLKESLEKLNDNTDLITKTQKMLLLKQFYNDCKEFNIDLIENLNNI